MRSTSNLRGKDAEFNMPRAFIPWWDQMEYIDRTDGGFKMRYGAHSVSKRVEKRSNQLFKLQVQALRTRRVLSNVANKLRGRPLVPEPAPFEVGSKAASVRFQKRKADNAAAGASKGRKRSRGKKQGSETKGG